MRPHRRALPIAAALFLAAGGTASAQVAPGFTLSGSTSSTTTHIYDTDGSSQHVWPSASLPGLAVYMRENGNLLRSEHPIGFPSGAGAGGRIEEIAWDGTVVWSYDYFIPGVQQQHHDIEPMPNGNVLLISWDHKSSAEAIANGRNPSTVFGSTFLPDKIVEVQPTGPTTGAVVWEWRAWDHLIQDFDPTKPNYGVVADHPELIDINWPPGTALGGDWMHSYCVSYNAELDQIVLSVNYFDEVWIIDHSTTTAEAAGHTGGLQGKGGDLLYRWGNPEAYDRGTNDDQILGGQHDTHWIKPGSPGAGNLIIFNNDAGNTGGIFGGYSSVVEVVTPVDGSGAYALTPGMAYGPAAPVWEYTAPNPTDLFTSVGGGGAERLPNGNTLISSPGQARILEVTAAKQTVWQKNGASTYKARRYERSLWTDGGSSISIGTGGSVDLDLVAGVERAGKLYLVLGSASGTAPGITASGFTLPLNPFDAYFNLTLVNPAGGPITPAFGPLDGQGKASVSVILPAGLNPGLAGLTLHHAYGVVDPVTGAILHASNAEPMSLLP